jgi:micrococcal nuclease
MGTIRVEFVPIAKYNQLVLGATVQIAYGGHRSDRYGRQMGHLFVERDGEIVWVQGELLKTGHARAYVLPGNTACISELLVHEKAAREERLGLWATSLYQPKAAAHTGQLMMFRSTFQIVRGTIKNVSHTKSAVFLNFGDDWKTDFTASTGKSVLAANGSWAASLDGLAGKNFAVRGWIERRNGPLIEIVDAAQIEILDQTPSGAQPPMPSPSVPDPQITSSMPQAMPKPAAPHPKQKRPEPKPPGAVNL